MKDKDFNIFHAPECPNDMPVGEKIFLVVYGFVLSVCVSSLAYAIVVTVF